MNEFDIINWIRKNWKPKGSVLTGPGDDCALVNMNGSNLVISIDTITQGVHFLPDTDPYRIGWKAAASSLSDIGACGCEPAGIVVSCLLPKSTSEEFVRDLFRGIEAVCTACNIAIAGGDISATKGGVTISVTSFGKVPEKGMVLRSSAQPGDAVLVTGILGGSFEGKHLTFLPRIAESLRIREIVEPSSMIDISDGLSSELNHISKESGVGIEVFLSEVPVSPDVKVRYSENKKEQMIHALTDGEDFELLFTVPGEDKDALLEQWDMDVPLTCIGICSEKDKSVVFRSDSIEISRDELKPYIHEF